MVVWTPRTRTLGVFAGLGVAVGLAVIVGSPLASPTVSAAAPKVDVCHRAGPAGPWTKLSIGQPALSAHLRNHDDAVPGGVTSESGTQLDANCQPVVHLQCRCWNTLTRQQLIDTLNAETVTAGLCTAERLVDNADLMPFLLVISNPFFACELQTSGSLVIINNLDANQASQCYAEVASITPEITWCPKPSK